VQLEAATPRCDRETISIWFRRELTGGEDKMKRVCLIRLLVWLAVFGLAMPRTMAQENKEKEQKARAATEARWSGVIVRLNQDVSTVTVRKQHIEKTIHFDSATKWTKGTHNIDMSQFKEGDRVICLGKYDNKEFVASRIDLREPHMLP